MPSANQSFAQRRPGLFGLCIAVAAVILVVGVAAAVGVWSDGGIGRFPGVSSSRFGLVRIEGTITESEKTVKFLRELREDDSVKGVVLRINSPGGAFGPSQEIYMAVKKLGRVKPVVASFSAVAASGGYYAACPAGRIFSNPGTITGSIGVMSQMANVTELLQKLGVSFESLTTGRLKDAGSPFKPLTPEQRAYLEGLINDLNKQFSGDVARERKLTPEAVTAIADGRAMTGARAKELGLVDVLGGQEDAIDYLKEQTGLTGDVPLLKGPKKGGGLSELFSSSTRAADLKASVLSWLLSGLGDTPDGVRLP
ncbi:signal peptide peptidase SppA [Solidesulfovibrio sp.]|uniref:signal peptide peptidase SppA n=1 Tax=Solidesulfovibrio sp. TaxID=2910990 RepID=UPI002619FE61|nr:signal peptide peptidase SppA [Solidesulfovibrio sp.]